MAEKRSMLLGMLIIAKVWMESVLPANRENEVGVLCKKEQEKVILVLSSASSTRQKCEGGSVHFWKKRKMAIWVPIKLMRLEPSRLPSLIPSDSASAAVAVAAAQAWKRKKKSGMLVVTVNCVPVQQLNPDAQRQTNDSEVLEDEEEQGVGIICEPCNGRGWLLCDFCKGQKTNVKAANNRIYRRCPNCKAVGYVLCLKCKVFKCVTYPDYSDGEL